MLKTTEVQLPFVGDEHFITEDLQSSSAGQRKYLPASKARNSNPFIFKYLEPNVKVCAGCPHPDNTFRSSNITLKPPTTIVVCHREIRQ